MNKLSTEEITQKVKKLVSEIKEQSRDENDEIDLLFVTESLASELTDAYRILYQ